jgi:lipocalin-like protein
MDRRTAMIAMGLAMQTSASARSGLTELIAVWRLVSCERESSGGHIDKPLGDKPVGRLIYDAHGRVSVQLMRASRSVDSAKTARTSWEAAQTATCDEIREMVAGYIAYFGTYDVDEATRTISHYVLGSLIPGWVGTSRKRNYELAGDLLKMTLQRGEVVERYIWQRDAG